MIQSVSRWVLAASVAAMALPGAALAQPTPSTMSVGTGQNPVIKVQANREKLRDIRLKLRDRGFENITFPGRTAPFRVNACRDGELLELTVGRAGKIRDRKPVGICGRSERFGAGSPVRRELRQKGYRGIEVFSEGPKRTLFMACKNGEKTRIIVTRNGDIRREVRVGACDKPRRAKPVDRDVRRPIGQPTNRLPRANRSDVIDQFLTRRRYSKVKVLEDDGDIVIAQACRRLRLFRIRLNMADRKVLKRKRVGWCDAPRGQRIARAPRPDFQLDSDKRIGGDKCQDAFEYLLDKDKVYFETASAEIGRASIPLLRRLARIARRCPSATIVIGGHTDSVGSDSSNQRLSEERAFSVLSYLRDNGIAKDRLSAIGYGEGRPVASNSDDEGRALNRRIEMLVEWEG